jgi:hypothetical protein
LEVTCNHSTANSPEFGSAQLVGQYRIQDACRLFLREVCRFNKTGCYFEKNFLEHQLKAASVDALQ